MKSKIEDLINLSVAPTPRSADRLIHIEFQREGALNSKFEMFLTQDRFLDLMVPIVETYNLIREGKYDEHFVDKSNS